MNRGCNNLLIGILCLIFICAISSCDNSSGNNPAGTGSASFQIQWPADNFSGVDASRWVVRDLGSETSETLMAANRITLSDDCDSRGVFTVAVSATDASATFLVSEQFACNRGVGKIKIPAGVGRRFVLSGLDSDGNERYHGEKADITIHAGANDIGVIQMERNSEFCTDADGDGYYAERDCGTAVDCDDQDANVYPGAIEICDGKDNNCDGSVDEGNACQVCTDADGDGYYRESGCGSITDCNDNDAAINPGAAEICDDGKDNDCDGLVDCDDPDCDGIGAACASPSMLWKKNFPMCIRCSPALGDDGYLYTTITSTCDTWSDNAVIKIDPESLEIIWGPVIPPGCSNANAQLSISNNGIVYVTQDWNSCGDGGLTAINCSDGTIIWHHKTSHTGYSPHTRQVPALDESLNSVYFGSTYLYSVNMDTGSDKWMMSGNYYIGDGIIIDSLTNVYHMTYAGYNRGKMLCSYSPSGTLRWKKTFPDINVTNQSVLSADIVVVTDYTNDRTILYDRDGNVLRDIDEGFRSFVEDESGDTYAAAISLSDVVSFLSDGTEQWRQSFNSPVRINFVDNASRVYVHVYDTIHALDTTDGSIAWSFTADAQISTSPILIAGGRLFFADVNSNVYLLDTKLNYAASAWPIAGYGNRRHTMKSGDILPLP